MLPPSTASTSAGGGSSAASERNTRGSPAASFSMGMTTVRADLSPPSTRARARARDGSENQRPWPADKVERWSIDRLCRLSHLRGDDCLRVLPGAGRERHDYAGTGAAAGRAFNSSSATNALGLRPAEIASTPMPMRSIKRPKSSGDAA